MKERVEKNEAKEKVRNGTMFVDSMEEIIDDDWREDVKI